MLRTLARPLCAWTLTLALPIVLAVASLHIVTDYWFLEWEYRRGGFPADPYGLSTEQRIEMAGVCVHYLITGADLSELEALTLPDGNPAFNSRELRHMDDVQRVYRGVSIAGIAAAMVAVASAAVLLLLERPRRHLALGLLRGGGLTLAILAAVAAYMALNWTAFFTDFHRLFFEGESWLFDYSDTLIRLFPVRFWIDVATLIVALVVVGAVLVSGLSWTYLRRKAPREGQASGGG